MPYDYLIQKNILDVVRKSYLKILNSIFKKGFRGSENIDLLIGHIRLQRTFVKKKILNYSKARNDIY